MADLASNPDSTVPNTSDFGIDTVARNLANAAIAAAAQPPQVSVDVSATYNTTTVQSQVGLQFGSVSKTFETPLGEKVVDSSLISKIRPRTIHFSAYHMKPNTRLYAFFDNVNVSNYAYMSYRIVLNKAIHANSSKSFSVSSNSVQVVFARGKTIYVNQSIDGNLAVANTFTWDGYSYTVVSVEKSTTLTTDVNGYIAGNFLIPPDTFDVGSRAFLLCDSSANNAAEITTSSEFMYYASGLANTKQSETLSTRINQVTINPLLKSSQTSVANTSVAPTTSNPVNPVVITVDTVAPIIRSYSPGIGDTGVLISGASAIFTFDKTIAAGSTYSSISVTKKNGTSPVTITKSLITVNTTSDTISIVFNSALEPGTEYKVNLPSGCVNDTSGNAYKDDGKVYSFTTVGAEVITTNSSYGSYDTAFDNWHDYEMINATIYIKDYPYDASRLVYGPNGSGYGGDPYPTYLRNEDLPNIYYKCVQVGSTSAEFEDANEPYWKGSSGKVSFDPLIVKKRGVNGILVSFKTPIVVKFGSITGTNVVKFKIEYYKDSLVGTPVFTSGIYTVRKRTSAMVIASITSSKQSDVDWNNNNKTNTWYNITEGATLNCAVKYESINFGSNPTVTWSVVGNPTSDDFSSAIAGSFTVSTSDYGTSSFSIPISTDNLQELNECGSIAFYNAGVLIGRSNYFQIIDGTSTEATVKEYYRRFADNDITGNTFKTDITNGTSFNPRLIIKNYSTDEPLYFRITSSDNINTTDYFNYVTQTFASYDSTTLVNIYRLSNGFFERTLPNTIQTKGHSFTSGTTKNFTIEASSDPDFNIIVASKAMTLTQPAVKSATITADKNSFVEGETVTFTVETNSQIGLTEALYFTLSGTNIDSNDFTTVGSDITGGIVNIQVPNRTVTSTGGGIVTFTKTIAINTD